MWMRCSVGQTWTGGTCSGEAKEVHWEEARKQTSSFAGHSDWRTPTIEELLTLVYCSSGKPEYFRTGADFSPCAEGYDKPTIVQSAFPNTPSTFVWSSSAHAYHSYGAWGVYFNFGDDDDNVRSGFRHVRLVRGGQ